MPNNNQTTIPGNLSQAPIPQPFVPQVQSGTVASSFDPSLSLNSQAFVQGSSSGLLSFPGDVGKYCFTIQFYNYSRESISTVGQLTPAAGYPSIVLPLPLQLLEPTQVAWEEVPINSLAQEVGGALGGAVGAFLGGLGGSIPGAAAGASAGSALGNFGQRFAEAKFGYMPNEFVTLLMRGPRFRRFHFTWELSPNNVEEANNLRDIITVWKNALSPQLALGGFLWQFPLVFRVRLYPNSSYLFKFKPCVCDNFFVDYTGGAGRAAFHYNRRQIDGENPPAIITLQASFIEIEMWTRGQFNTSNDPDDVEGDTTSSASGIEDNAQLGGNFPGADQINPGTAQANPGFGSGLGIPGTATPGGIPF